MLTLLLIKKCLWHFFVILRIHKASLGSCEVPQKFGYDRFSSYGVYRLQTSKVYIYIFVDIYLYSPWSTYIWSTKRRSALLKILDIKSISTMCRYPTRFFSLSSTFIPLDIYHKGWDFRDDCAEFILCTNLYLGFPTTVHWFISYI